MRGSRKWVVLGVAVGSLALWPAGAGAAPIDEASAHAALVAYDTYLHGLVSNIPAAHAATDAYVSSIVSRCPDVLAAVNLLPPGSFNRGAVFAVFEEAGGDLSAAANASTHAPLAKLATALRRLRWSSPQASVATRRYLAAQRRLYWLVPSHLCADLQALATSNAQRTPRGTLRWLAKLGRVVAAQERQFTAFENVLEPFDTPADAGVVADVNRTWNTYVAARKSMLTNEATRLLAALGLSS